MIFEVFLGFLALFLLFLIIGFTYHNWFFTLGAGIILFLLTALLWSSSSIDYHSGNNVSTDYSSDENGTILASSEDVNFVFTPIEGFNKDMFALFTLISSLAVFFMSLEQKKVILGSN